MCRLLFPEDLAASAAVLDRRRRDAAVVVLVAGAPTAALVIADEHSEAFAVGVAVTLAPHDLAAWRGLRFERCPLADHHYPPAKGWAERVTSVPLTARQRKTSAWRRRWRCCATRPHRPRVWLAGCGSVLAADAPSTASGPHRATSRQKQRVGTGHHCPGRPARGVSALLPCTGVTRLSLMIGSVFAGQGQSSDTSDRCDRCDSAMLSSRPMRQALVPAPR